MKDKAILFDLDGTLLDTLDDLKDAVNEAMTAFGYPPRTRDEVRGFIGNGIANTIRMALPCEVPQERFDEVLRVFRESYQSHLTVHTRPYPGIREILTELKEAGVKMAVVTNKFQAGAQELTDVCLPGLIDLTQGETPEFPKKPAPDVIFDVMKRLGVEEALYVGDSPVDAQTAKNAKLPFIAVTWGFADAAEMEKSGARFVCRDAQSLREALEKSMESNAQITREALFREAYDAARRSALQWIKEEPDCAEAHLACALAAGKLSGRAFNRKEEFLSEAKKGMDARDEDGVKEEYFRKLLACLDGRFAPYARIRPGFVFSAKEEALEYFSVLEELTEVTQSLYEMLGESASDDIRLAALRPIGRLCRAAAEKYYFEDVSVDANVPVTRKRRIRYGLVHSLRAASLYRKADADFQKLPGGSEELESLLLEEREAKGACQAARERQTQAQAETDKLEQLRAQNDLASASLRLEEAEKALNEYRSSHKREHL